MLNEMLCTYAILFLVACFPVQAEMSAITPRESDARLTIGRDLSRGGYRVFVLPRFRSLVVPGVLRSQNVSGKELITAIAKRATLTEVWADARTVILEERLDNTVFDSLAREIESTDSKTRDWAARRVGWTCDARAVRLLLKAAEDADHTVAETAKEGLRRFGWNVVMSLDRQAEALLCAELERPEALYRADAVQGLASLPPQKALIGIKKSIGDAEVSVRTGAVLALGALGEPFAHEVLIDLYEKKDFDVHLATMVALAHTRQPDVVKMLAGPLRDHNEGTRYQAVFALGQTGQPEAVQDLETALKDKSENVACAAIAALGEVGGDRALYQIKEATNDKRGTIRAAAIESLGRFPARSVLPLLEEALKDPNTRVRRAACWSLGEVAGTAAVQLLEAVLSEDDISHHAITGLARTDDARAAKLVVALAHSDKTSRREGCAGALAFLPKEDALAAAAILITDSIPSVRCACAASLGMIGGDPAMSLISRLLEDPDFTVRSEAFSSLARIGGEKAYTAIKNQLSKKEDFCESELSALACFGGSEVTSFFVQLASHKNFHQRRMAMCTARNLGPEHAMHLYQIGLKDPSSDVRKAAIASVAFLGDKALPLLDGLLSDDSPQVRLMAVGSLSNMGAAAVDLLGKASRDPSREIRSCAYRALIDIGGQKARHFLLDALRAEREGSMDSDLVTMIRNRFSDDPEFDTLLPKLKDK